jgi:hypothetical protein
MKTLTAIALATGLALSAGTAASAMTDEDSVTMGENMLTGALYNSLSSQGFPTEGIAKLTLSEVVLLNSLLSSDENSASRHSQIELILEHARAR